MKQTFEVFNTISGFVVRSFSSRRAAMKCLDRLNADYGGYKYYLRVKVK